MPVRTKPYAFAIAFGIAVGILFVSAIPVDQTSRSNAYWAMLGYRGVLVDTYESLPDFVHDSDLVIIGHITGARPGRILGDLTNDDAAYYIENDLAIDRVIFDRTGDTIPPPTLTFETHTFEPALVPVLVAEYPRERAVFFLRSNAEGARRAGHSKTEQMAEAPYWHVVNPEGVLRDLPGGTEPVSAESAFIREFRSMDFGEVVRALENAARESPLSDTVDES